ncbi:hypothetical protein EWB00_000356 [Schistosoma japonicum]|uniref:Uncharacterized protein n=1 Tax=Schistosoma japonicum TaxID=6182 RepID=A0A4Z2DJ22_SCHJA|nr:hypothetical protein EWB00_000356 [Schistosoma japonicum]
MAMAITLLAESEKHSVKTDTRLRCLLVTDAETIQYRVSVRNRQASMKAMVDGRQISWTLTYT